MKFVLLLIGSVAAELGGSGHECTPAYPDKVCKEKDDADNALTCMKSWSTENDGKEPDVFSCGLVTSCTPDSDTVKAKCPDIDAAKKAEDDKTKSGSVSLGVSALIAAATTSYVLY